MPQTTNTEYDQVMQDPSKPLDYILAIAGWPTLYSVVDDTYALAGDLANFDTVRDYMDIPKIAAQTVKGFPEGGSTAHGQLDVSINDKVVAGVRHLSDLASRFAYLLNESTGTETQLSLALTNTGTTVNVDSTTGFDSPSGKIWLGKECIAYTGTTATSFTGCTRGYLLTDAAAHADNLKVYSYMPSVTQRKAYLYKGSPSLTLDKWVPAFGGLIVSEGKSGTQYSLAVQDMGWQYYAGGILFANPWAADDPMPKNGKFNSDLLGYEFGVGVDVRVQGGILTTGRMIMWHGQEYFAVRGAT